MSRIPQNYCDENQLIDCVQRFFSRHHVGKLLAKCNGIDIVKISWHIYLKDITDYAASSKSS